MFSFNFRIKLGLAVRAEGCSAAVAKRSSSSVSELQSYSRGESIRDGRKISK